MAPTPRKSTPKAVAGTAESSVTEPAANAETLATNTEPIAEPVEPVAEAVPEPAAEAGARKAAEVEKSVRKVSERSLEQTRAAYNRFRAVSEETASSFETSCVAATKGLHEFNTTAIDALKSNADAVFDLVKALMKAKTLSEAITLQTEHARKQFEALTAQTEELAEIVRKVATETTEPLKKNVTRTFGKAA